LLKGSTLVTVPLHNLYSKNPVELYLDGGQFTASIAQIIHYLPSTPYPLPPITGQVTLFNESLSLDIQQLDHQGHGLPMINLHSPIRFSTSNILVSNSLNIGVFNGKITSTSTPLSYQLFLTNPSTPLMMTGYSVLTAHEIYWAKNFKMVAMASTRGIQYEKIDENILPTLHLMAHRT